jgi:hypothetical protein
MRAAAAAAKRVNRIVFIAGSPVHEVAAEENARAYLPIRLLTHLGQQ